MACSKARRTSSSVVGKVPLLASAAPAMALADDVLEVVGQRHAGERRPVLPPLEDAHAIAAVEEISAVVRAPAPVPTIEDLLTSSDGVGVTMRVVEVVGPLVHDGHGMLVEHLVAV